MGLGIRRSPTSADLATIAAASSTTVTATSTIAVPTNPRQAVLPNGSVSGAMFDAALASILGVTVGDADAPDSTIKPGAPAVSAGPVPGPGAIPRKRTQESHRSRPYPQPIAAVKFSRKGRSMGQPPSLDPRSSARDPRPLIMIVADRSRGSVRESPAPGWAASIASRPPQETSLSKPSRNYTSRRHSLSPRSGSRVTPCSVDLAERSDRGRAGGNR